MLNSFIFIYHIILMLFLFLQCVIAKSFILLKYCFELLAIYNLLFLLCELFCFFVCFCGSIETPNNQTKS